MAVEQGTLFKLPVLAFPSSKFMVLQLKFIVLGERKNEGRDARSVIV